MPRRYTEQYENRRGAPAFRLATIQIDRRKGRDHEYMVADGKLAEVGTYGLSGEHMSQAIGTRFDGVPRLRFR
jgi:hypothetical protein